MMSLVQQLPTIAAAVGKTLKKCRCSIALFLALVVAFQWNVVQGANKVQAPAPYACKSPSGKNVDWFVAYKLPKQKESEDAQIAKGTAFLYADSTNASWQLSKVSVEDKKSTIGRTVEQIFKAKENPELDFLMLYNDDGANEEKAARNLNMYRGHMKGVLVADSTSGFWLIHSVPKFPASNTNNYQYPKNGKPNGQSFLCITFNTDKTMKDIGTLLFVAQPPIYEVQLPDKFAADYAELASLANKERISNKHIPTVEISFRSSKNQEFRGFFKHKKYDGDLYYNLIAPSLGTSLYVESWMRGGTNMPTVCEKKTQIYNIQSMHFKQPLQIEFPNNNDHSKWAVSVKDNWICIGDINRQESQRNRGGGAVCLQNGQIAGLYRSAINGWECCDGESGCPLKNFPIKQLPIKQMKNKGKNLDNELATAFKRKLIIKH